MRRTLTTLIALLCVLTASCRHARRCRLASRRTWDSRPSDSAASPRGCAPTRRRRIIPGPSYFVARRGKIAMFRGQRLVPIRQTKAPMTRDAIFRIYFHEQAAHVGGPDAALRRRQAHARPPVSKYIPRSANLKSAYEKVDGAGVRTLELVPSRATMSIGPAAPHLRSRTGSSETASSEGVRRRNPTGDSPTNARWSSGSQAGFGTSRARRGITATHRRPRDRLIEVISGTSLYPVPEGRLLDRSA